MSNSQVDVLLDLLCDQLRCAHHEIGILKAKNLHLERCMIRVQDPKGNEKETVFSETVLQHERQKRSVKPRESNIFEGITVTDIAGEIQRIVPHVNPPRGVPCTLQRASAQSPCGCLRPSPPPQQRSQTQPLRKNITFVR